MKKLNLIGRKFGNLIVEARGPATGMRVAKWTCRCKCGGSVDVRSAALINGHTRSCGCLVRRHGYYQSKTYKTWQNIIQRCHNPKDTRYKHYGARGIAVCVRWRKSFIDFLTDMGERPSNKHSIDRIDTNGDYLKENCRWALPTVQQTNKRNTHFLVHNGEKEPLVRVAEKFGIHPELFRSRIKRGWSIENAGRRGDFRLSVFL